MRKLLVLTQPRLASEIAPPYFRYISRTNYKFDLFHFDQQAETISEIQNARGSKSFADCCRDRALDLLKENRSEYWLMYSGGIDSTCLMTAILETWDEPDLERLVVLFSTHSVLENPEFVNRHFKRLRWRSSFQSNSEELLRSPALLVTGELGDQLFGSESLEFLTEKHGDEALHRPFETFARETLLLELGNQKAADAVYDRLLPCLVESLVPIKTTFDFFWWINFSQKWQYVKYRFFEMESWQMQARYGTHVTHFFDTIDFQRWSVANHDEKIGPTWNTYKKAAKEYIHHFNQGSSDLNLPKVQSLGNFYNMSYIRPAIDHLYNVVSDVNELNRFAR